jgi:hypothetical protein
LLETVTRQLLVRTLRAEKVLVCAVVICKVCVDINDDTISERNYELCVNVVNKSNIQSKTPSIATPYYVRVLSSYIHGHGTGNAHMLQVKT